jgi:hypothetical protein
MIDQRTVTGMLRTGTLLTAWLCLPAAGAAQQFVTMEAWTLGPRACALDAWHGEASSLFQPRCRPGRFPEVAAGIGTVRATGGRMAEYLLEVKHGLDVPAGWPEAALVAGVGYDPRARLSGGVASVFALVPVSVPLAAERVWIHGNLGWLLEREAHEHEGILHEERYHSVSWAGRLDVLLPVAADRLTLIGEFFGHNHLPPELQAGIRAELVRDRLFTDLTWGGSTAGRGEGAGWTFGVSWSPPPF